MLDYNPLQSCWVDVMSQSRVLFQYEHNNWLVYLLRDDELSGQRPALKDEGEKVLVDIGEAVSQNFYKK